MKLLRKTYAEIDLDALEANWNFLQKNFPGNFICPMVKANAYGHGDVMVARALETWGAQHLGVCLIEEGLLLRRFGVKTEILVFRGFDQEGAEVMIENNLTPVVSTWEQFEALETVAKAEQTFHLKFDTGMNRLGFSTTEALALAEKIKNQKKLKLAGVLTHLVSGENSVDTHQTDLQFEMFQKVVEIFQFFKVPFHVLNSGGVLTQLSLDKKNSSSTWLGKKWGLRPGLMLYGYNPGVSADFPELKVVMTLKSQIAVIRKLAVNEGVSYNHTWKAKKDSRIAVVPIGYADGYHRSLSNKGVALYHGKKVPVIGNVCMDYLMLDISEAPESEDSEIILFGQNDKNQFLSAQDLATAGQTITWEILTSVSERVPRIYKGKWAQKIESESRL